MIREDFLEEVGRRELNRWREIDFQEPEECRDMKYDRRQEGDWPGWLPWEGASAL